MQTRRDFLSSLGRFSILAAGAVLGGVLIGRRQVRLQSSQTCQGQGLCGKCQSYNGCGLPAALSRKKKLNRSSGPQHESP